MTAYFNLTSILLLDDVSQDSARDLIKSCMNFAVIRDKYYPRMDYSVTMLSLKTVNGIKCFLDEMSEFLSEHSIESRSWLQEDDYIVKDKLTLLSSAQWMIGGTILLHDIPVSHTQAATISQIAQQFAWNQAKICLQNTGLFKKERHFALLPSSLLGVLRQTNLRDKPNTLSSLIDAIECGAKHYKQVKITKFRL